MMLGSHAIAEYPLAVLPAEYDRSIPNPVPLLLEDPDAEFEFLFFGYPVDVSSGQTVPVYLSHRSFVSRPDDDPPGTIFPGRLYQPLNYEVAVALPGEGDAAGTASFGEITILNADGALDHLLGLSWEGRPVEIRIGGTIRRGRHNERRLRLVEYQTLWRGTVAQLAWDEREIRLSLQDPAAALREVGDWPVYAGTGGLEGGPDLKGVAKPRGWGRIRNASPPCVDTAYLVYQVHAGPIDSVQAVRDKGVPLTGAGTVSDVYAWTPEEGAYVVDLSRGLIRLGATPAGTVTVDFRGDADGGYVETAALVAERIAIQVGGMTAAEIDGAAILTYPDDAPVGIWTGTAAVSAAQLISEALGAVDGRWFFDRSGRLTVRRWEAPGDPVVALTLARDGIAKDRSVYPRWRYRIGYGRLMTLQAADQLADSLSAEDKAVWSQEYRYAVSEDMGTRAACPVATEEEIGTALALEADAEAEASRRRERDAVPRDVLKVMTIRRLFQLRVGDTVLVRHPRAGLAAGKPMRIAGIAEDVRQMTVQLTLWG